MSPIQSRWLAAPQPEPQHVLDGVPLLGAMLASTEAACEFALPAHAMATCTWVLRGAIWCDGKVQAPCAIGGAFRRAQTMRVAPGTTWVSVFARADAWVVLSGQPGRAFANQYQSVQTLAPGAVRLAALCSTAASTLDFAQAALQALRLDLQPHSGRPETQTLNGALQALKVGDLSTVRNSLGASERFIQRLFQHELGMPAMQVLRLSRLNRAVQTMALEPEWSLVDLALECGYADQAHMARDFRLLVGVPAGAGEASLWALREGGRMLAPNFFGL